MKAVLDTSVLIGEDAPADIEAAISVASITELHFGVLVTDDADERARRADRLAAVESTFDPLPVTLEVARARGPAGGGSRPAWRQAAPTTDRPGDGCNGADQTRAAADPQRCGLPDHR
ncbi:MAG: PIN domain nuclease [Actinomycetota bacterium]|nr:PIN domain nuclease [Actinomycetota bacterium]